MVVQERTMVRPRVRRKDPKLASTLRTVRVACSMTFVSFSFVTNGTFRFLSSFSSSCTLNNLSLSLVKELFSDWPLHDGAIHRKSERMINEISSSMILFKNVLSLLTSVH